jgi:chemotaxis signal transduction protein
MDSQLKKTLNSRGSSSVADNVPVSSSQEQLGTLLFSLPSSGNVGVPVACVEEILPVSQLHFIPAVPDYILGVMIWHLEIIAVLDIEKLLRISSQPSDSRTARFLIMRWEESVFALKVPSVVDIIAVPVDRIQKISVLLQEHPHHNFFQGYIKMDKETITMLNLKELVKAAVEEI